MKFYLDTNICIYFLKSQFLQLLDAIMSHSPDDIKISSVVKAELLYGAEKSQKREENLEKVRKFLLPFEIISFDDKAAVEYSVVRASMQSAGIVIGPNDLIIAATVLSHCGTLVTNNEKEFRMVPGLKVENWLAK
ncbi:MAG: type II toxin-antitoxin system VapC family toxin [Dethiobacter sp.]|jgi:tRNA(fMet)-specific endonuclease VapC|nr:type II toxin-antitoxin system VapC family toxin [Dethiobacter sp.]MBS3901143.1 type II toxin-antitoxin system VapC family toxin [Dethiobacter sp.]MBS3989065.1 type II toxin-antitoxin system VapC family toxin [Dethiobacter sp.]